MQLQNVGALASLVGQKIAELRMTLDLFRRTEIPRALDVVRSDEAAAVMGWIRQLIAEMRAREDARLEAGRSRRDASWTPRCGSTSRRWVVC